MWGFPTMEHLASSPWVDGIDYSQDVDGVWDQTASAMIITLREWAGKGTKVVFEVKTRRRALGSSYKTWAIHHS